MHARKSRFVLALMVAAALVLSGCSSTTSTTSAGSSKGGGLPAVATPEQVVQTTLGSLKGKTVKMVVITDGTPITQSWISRAKHGFAEVGVNFSVTSANFDNKVLAQQVQTAINQKPDALILHNADLTVLASLIKQAQSRGIYVVVMNLGSNAQSDAFVGPNWLGMAGTLAKRMASDCKAKGKTDVAIITGFGTDTGSVLTETGAKAALKGTGITVVASQPGEYDPSKANNVAKTLLQQHPDLCGFLGSWDVMMTGVSKAVDEAGDTGKVGVYTLDSSSVSCQAIGRGSLTAAVNFGASTTMGDSAVAIVDYLLQSGVKAGTTRTAIYTSAKIIDKKNYKDPDACYGPPSD